MLGAHAGVVEAGGDGVGVDDVALWRLEQHRLGAVQDADASAVDRGRVLSRRDAAASRLNPDEAHRRVVDEPGEKAHGV